VAEQPLTVELEQEADGRWLAEVIDLPGILAYGATHDEALAMAEALALRVIADRLEHGERAPELNNPPSNLSRFVART
jgi:predicted RNase H-like HicB family nuclease